MVPHPSGGMTASGAAASVGAWLDALLTATIAFDIVPYGGAMRRRLLAHPLRTRTVVLERPTSEAEACKATPCREWPRVGWTAR